MKGNVLVIIFADLSCLINEHNHLSIFVSAAIDKYCTYARRTVQRSGRNTWINKWYSLVFPSSCSVIVHALRTTRLHLPIFVLLSWNSRVHLANNTPKLLLTPIEIPTRNTAPRQTSQLRLESVSVAWLSLNLHSSFCISSSISAFESIFSVETISIPKYNNKEYSKAMI